MGVLISHRPSLALRGAVRSGTPLASLDPCGPDQVFIDFDSEPCPLRKVDISVRVPDRVIHQIQLRWTIYGLQLKQMAGRAGKTQRLTCGSDDRGREVMRIGLPPASSTRAAPHRPGLWHGFMRDCVCSRGRSRRFRSANRGTSAYPDGRARPRVRSDKTPPSGGPRS